MSLPFILGVLIAQPPAEHSFVPYQISKLVPDYIEPPKDNKNIPNSFPPPDYAAMVQPLIEAVGILQRENEELKAKLDTKHHRDCRSRTSK